MKAIIILTTACAAAGASAQLVITGPGPYTQDFDSLPSTGTGIAWTNNLPTPLMPGWHSSLTTFDADDGNMVNTGAYSYGTTGSGERALGSISLMGALIRYGLQMNNASGSTLGSLAVSYRGEQWRSGSALTDVLLFEYSTNATSLMSGTWTPVSALDFNSPTNTGTFALNGNLAVNQAVMSSTITGLNWLNGSDMWIRWTHVGNASRHGMAIDDVVLQTNPVPEPSTMAALGVAFIGLARRRRRTASGQV